MNWGFLLGFVGTVATVIFGIWGIYLAIRQRYPGRIAFFNESCIGLFDSIVRNLPELSVQFRGAPVEENLVLLKGFFLNTGSKDISQGMVERRLRAVLPEGYRWLTAKVVELSPEVRAEVQVASEAMLEFDLGLFRCGEFIKWEALSEVPAGAIDGGAPAASLERDLTFDHRIADTGRIKAESLPEDNREFRGVLKTLAMMILAAGVSFFLLFSLWPKGAEKLLSGPINPTFVIQRGGRGVEVNATSRTDGLIEVRELRRGGFLEVLTAQQFKAMKPEIVFSRVKPDGFGTFMLVMCAAFSAMAGAASWVMAWKYRKFGKITSRSRDASSGSGSEQKS